MRTDLFDYDLPPERIAQTPLPRGESRLLTLGRNSGQITRQHFPELLDYLRAGDTLVLNDTRVTARRLRAERENGLPAEVLLLRPVGAAQWETLTRPAKGLKPGRRLTISGPNGERLPAVVLAATDAGGRVIELENGAARDALAGWGESPLPPYIHTPLPASEEERYQTVYAAANGDFGSVAAPTAGLHFTPELLAAAQSKGVALARLTLHVGIGTFRPVKAEDTDDHVMHAETVVLSESCADIINATTGRVIAVGTTSVRSLESAAARLEPGNGRRVAPFTGETDLFITPGYEFKVVDAMLTNFHLPQSTLLMLVAAFAGYEATMNAYRVAVEEKYRFFSFGDAMLII